MNFDIESIKGLLDGLDPAALLPDVNGVVGAVTAVCRLAILVGPLLMVLMGIGCLFFAPKEANYYFGYRTPFGMGSVSAWRHTQKVAGILYLAVGGALTMLMLMAAASFNAATPMDTVWAAAKCLLWQLAAALVLKVSIGSAAAFTFDYKGNKRKKK